MRRAVLTLGLVLAAITPPMTSAGADAPATLPLLDNPLDRDGDGRIGEDTTIKARVRNYLERHGDSDQVTSEAMAAKTRWAYDRYLDRQRSLDKGIDGDGWVSLGPNNGAGRATCVVPHPTEADTVLAGAAGGGVWKSTDSGLTWRSLTDGLVSDLSVGAVAYAPSDPDVLYLGTGEGGYAIDFIPGIGLVRSEDGGETWILPDYAVAPMFFALSVDPRDADSLLAATNVGLLSSVDGGVTWSVPLAPSGIRGVTEVIRSEADPDLVYAAVWCAGACRTGSGRVMRSTDNGTTWASAASGLPPANANDYSLNRNSLTVSPADDRVLYVGLTVPGTGNTPASRVYRSTDGGDSWIQVTQPSPYLGSQGWYDNAVTSKPSDPDVVIAAGVYYTRSDNGGSTWTDLNPYQGAANAPHVDGHDLQWQGETLWVACDGGIWKSTDDGRTWADRNSGLVTRQYYALALDPLNRQRVIAGSQDNGTDRRRDAGDDTWDAVEGGDGFECAINPLFPDLAYATVQFGVVGRSTSGGSPYSFREISPGYGADVTPFITLLTMRPDAPWVLYSASTRVFRSDDAGDSWTPLGTRVDNGAWNTSVAWSVAVTPADPQVVMVAKNVDVYRSTDGGGSWLQSRQGDGGLSGRRVVNVEISPFDADVALACMAGTTGVRAFRTVNGGATWEASDHGLPPFTVQVARWDPTDPSVVYAGTDVGVYRSTDAGVTWDEYGDGLPAASIHDIQVLPDGSMLRIATHGRGVWELDIPQPPNGSPAVSIDQPTADPLVTLGESYEFRATAADPDGDPVTLRWVATDTWQGGQVEGVGGASATFSLPFGQGGVYPVVVQATDGRGGVANASRKVFVLDPADRCETPRAIPGEGPFPLSIRTSNELGARQNSDPRLPCVGGDPVAGTQGSTWFELEPAVTGRYAVSTCGSLADTVLSVWTGAACGPYAPVPGGCNDDDELVHCNGRRTDSYVEVDLVAGETYRLLVGSYAAGSKGPFRLNVDCLDCSSSPDPVEYLVPAAAHNPGLNDTSWVTDLDLLNPGGQAANADLYFLPSGVDNSAAEAVSVEIPAGTSLALRDVVSALFGTEGSGAIRVRSSSPLVIASRTFTTGDDGTYGQYIAGVPASEATPPGGAALLAGLERSDAFRTNLGLANASATAATALVELRDATGALLSTRDVNLPPYGFLQITDIFAVQGHPQVANGYAVVRNTTADAGFIAYASVVDERTGDPVAVTATEASRPDAPLWVAAAVHDEGVGGTVWRTDLDLVNSGADPLEASVALLPAGQDNSNPDTAPVTVPAGNAVRVGDALSELFGTTGSGALRIAAEFHGLAVTSRTYNLTPDGTYGQHIPGVTSARAIGSGQIGALVQLRRSNAFRTNVGVVNLTSAPISVEAVYFAADGSELGRAGYDLEPLGFHQANGAIPGTVDVDGGFAVVSSPDPGAVFLAYASVVDNGSGDPVFVPAVAVD